MNELIKTIIGNNYNKINRKSVPDNNGDILQSLTADDIPCINAKVLEDLKKSIATLKSGVYNPSLHKDIKNKLFVQNNVFIDKLKGFVVANKPDTVSNKYVKNVIAIIEKLGIMRIIGANQCNRDMSQLYIAYSKNSIKKITVDFPNMSITRKNDQEISTPMHWKISGVHVDDVKSIVSKRYLNLNDYDNTETIVDFFYRYKTAVKVINELTQHTIIYHPKQMNCLNENAENVDREGEAVSMRDTRTPQRSVASTHLPTQRQLPKETNIMFDTGLSILLFRFYVYSALHEMIELVGSDVFKRATISPQDATPMKEVVFTTICSYLMTIGDDQELIDYDYSRLMGNIRKYKDTEKRVLLDSRSAGKMTDDKKDTDKILQKHKLGRWNKGLQKGVYKYDVKTYNEERTIKDKAGKIVVNPLFSEEGGDVQSDDAMSGEETLGLDKDEPEEIIDEDDHQENRNEDDQEPYDEDGGEYDNEEGFNDARPYDD